MNGNLVRLRRRGLRLGGWLALWIGLVSGAPLAAAATYVVDTTSAGVGINACTAAPNDCSFEGALQRSVAGDLIQFAVASASATNGVVQIQKNVTIDANGAALPVVTVSSSSPVQITATIRNARFENLKSAGPGGALYVQTNQTLTIQDSRFTNNRNLPAAGNQQGGAIYTDGRLYVMRTTFDGNYGIAGGSAIHNGGNGLMEISDSVFTGNGIYANNGNPLRAHFGAIANDGAAVFTNCLFKSNDADYAAAIQSGGSLWISSSTFVNNITRGPTESGAVLVGGSSTILNVTMVGNSGATSGGLYVYAGAQARVGNSLFSDNLGAAPNINGTIQSLGNNLIRDPTGTTVTGVSTGNLYNVDPRVLPLANNGGGSMTVALASDSPAIDEGSNCVLANSGCATSAPYQALSTDQRGSGFGRQKGAKVDIGAYEAAYLTVINANDSGAGSLRQAISDAVDNDVIVFSPAVFNVARTISLASTLTIGKTIGIRGPGSALLTLDGNNTVEPMVIGASGNLTLSGLRITRGNAGAANNAGAMLVVGTLTGDDLVMDNSRASNLGGCLFNTGTTVLTRLVVTGCQAPSGAGIFNDTGKTLTISDSRVENNTATSVGGAIYNVAGLTLKRVSLTGNTASSGGAVYNTGAMSADGITVSGNSATTGLGGGLYQGAAGAMSLLGTTITANTSSASGGGGLYGGGGPITIAGTLIAGNSGTSGQPDAVATLISNGYNLIGSTAGNSFAVGSPSLAGNVVNIAPKLSPLADNGGTARSHAPLYDSPILDAAGAIAGSALDGRGYARPIDFDNVANASGGDGRDIGAYELQVATPSGLVATPQSGALSVAFDGAAHGGLAPTGFSARCGAQTATGSASPVVVSGLSNGTAVSCTVTAMAGAISGIASAPSAAVAPAAPPGAPTLVSVTPANGQISVAFSAPASNGGSPITGYTATCGGTAVNGPSSPISVNGLINQSTVTCTVLARNVVGAGPSSSPSSSVTPGLPGFGGYVPRVGIASAAVFDLAGGSLTTNIGLPSGNAGVAASPDGARVYLATQSSNQVTVINTQTNSVVGQVAVGNAPWSAAVSSDSRRVYVTNSGDSTVSVIDALTNTVVQTVPVFNHPYGVAVSPDGAKVYVTNSGTNAISVIDAATLTTSGPFTAAMDPIGIATSPDGRRVYVTSQTQNVVAVMDTTDNSLVATVPVGSTPYGVVVSRDNKWVFVANAGSNSVSVINATSNTIFTTLPVGMRPQGIDLSPDGSRVFVVDRDSNDIKVINATTMTVIAGGYSLGAGSSAFAMGRFVAVGGVAASFTSVVMPDAAYGQSYNQPIPVAGTPRPGLTLVSGSLPSGLFIDPTTGAIYGTSTAVGSYNLSIRAANGVGGPVTQVVHLNVVPTRPGAPSIDSITPGDGIVTLSVSPSSNSGGSALLTYNARCSTVPTTFSTNVATISLPVPNGQPTSCRVSAVNAVGESDWSADSAVVIPGIAPGITSGEGSAGIFGGAYLYTVPVAGDPAPTLQLTAGSLPPGLDFNPENHVVSGTPAAVGNFTATFTASNALGDSSRAVLFRIGPDVAHPPHVTGVVGGDQTVRVTFVEDAFNGGSAVSAFHASCDGSPTETVGPASPLTVGGLPNGVVTYCRVYATNDGGNSPASADSDAVVPGILPGFSTGAPQEGAYATSYSFRVIATGVPTPTLALTGGSLPPGLTFDPDTGIVTGTPTASGDFAATVTATNAVGSTPQALPFHIAPVVPHAPQVTGVEPGDGRVRVNYSADTFDGGASVQSFTASCDGSATTSTGGGASLVVTGLPNGVPTHCRVFATNAAGNSPPSADSDVTTPGTAPTITSAATATATYGQPFTFVVTTTGAPAPSVTLDSGSLPSGLGFANGVINGTPSEVTTAVLQFHAANSLGAVDQAFQLVVGPAPPSAPTQINAHSGHGSATLTFVAPTSSGGVAILGYTATCSPGAITASATVTTIEVPLTNGSIYDCSVHATNVAGDSPESISIRVLPRAVDSTDLAIAISNGTPYVIGGMPTTYVITVDNNGAAGVVAARVQDTLGSEFSDAHWTCLVRDGADCPASGSGDLDTQVDLPPGSGVRIELTATVAPLPETPVSTVVSVTGPADVSESDLANNVASDGPDGRGLFKDGFE